MIIRQDPEVERAAIERLVHDVLHGEHDEEGVRLADEAKRLWIPAELRDGDDAAA